MIPSREIFIKQLSVTDYYIMLFIEYFIHFLIVHSYLTLLRAD